MKPWTWKQLAKKSVMPEDADAFVNQYGKLGALALEVANRLEYPEYDDLEKRPGRWKEFCMNCSCAMCKQWHHSLSDAQVVALYRRLFKRSGGAK